MVSDVGDRLPGLEVPPQLAPEQARFRLFDSITAFLKSAGKRQPLVLVLDDLHWADQPSLLLLEFVAKELGDARLMLIGTYRDMELSRQHPLSKSLGELTRSAAGGFQRVLLRGLDQEDVGRFIELASGVAPPTGLVEAVHRQTEGNPLFITEVVRLLVQEGELTQEKAGQRDFWSVRIPEGVREVIGRRLDRLSERCNETLTVASVVGREFTLEQLSPLIEDISGDRLLEVLDEALSARVIEELPRAVGRYQFTHALIQETLAGELTTTRKVRLHARIAEALEKLYEGQEEAHAAELVQHFAEAESILGPVKLIKYSLAAGERALTTYAYEEAHDLFQQALTAKESSSNTLSEELDPEHAAIVFGLLRAQIGTLEPSQLGDAVGPLRRAFEYYTGVGDIDRVLYLARAIPPILYPGRTTGTLQYILKALDLVPPDSLEAAQLLSMQGYVLAMEIGDDEASRETFDRALAIAHRENDAGIESRILSIWVCPLGFQLQYKETAERSLQTLELGRGMGKSEFSVRDPLIAAICGSNAQIAMAQLKNARQLAKTGLELAEELRDRTLLGYTFSTSMWLEILDGNWVAARDLAERGQALSPRFPDLLAASSFNANSVGDFALGKADLAELIEVMRRSEPGPTSVYALTALIIPLTEHIRGGTDNFDLAQQAAETILSSPHALNFATVLARTGLSLMAVVHQDPVAAQEQYAELASIRGTLLTATFSGGFMSGDRLLGLLAHTMSKFDHAQTHFEDAVFLCRQAGARPELAWSLYEQAKTLLQLNNEGDRAKANALLDESLAISSELGMRPLMERVLSRREILGA